MKINDGDGIAYTNRARGKKTTLSLEGKPKTDILKVRVVGREEATSAENARDMFLMRLLQGTAALGRSQFIRLLWFPRHDTPRSVPSVQCFFDKLNPSQNRVANAMVSGANLIDRVQGELVLQRLLTGVAHDSPI